VSWYQLKLHTIFVRGFYYNYEKSMCTIYGLYIVRLINWYHQYRERGIFRCRDY